MDDISELLKQSLGLDVSSIGRSTVERAVTSRMTACALTDPGEYREYVRSSRTELQALIEAVVVPETWFFRDPEAFAVLARAAVDDRWVQGGRTMRVLSVPCSTGEEPYSIAMALLDAGLAPETFHVDAIDVSREAVARTTAAQYGRNSFRGRDLDYRDRHFSAGNGSYHLAERVRNQVSVRQGNLFSLDAPGESNCYDAIFCRNLMIYFDRPTQDRAVLTLQRRLGSNGLLFVAPSETAIVLNHAFTPVKVPLAFAFRRSSHEAAVRKSPRITSVPPQPVPRTVPAQSVLRTLAAPASGPHGAVETESLLDEAARLANGGNLPEAAKRCEAHLKRFGPSARVFHLLGMVRDAAGAPSEAAAWYRKALYLDPHHQEVLLHLALILEQLGEHAESSRLRARAARVRPSSAHPHDNVA